MNYPKGKSFYGLFDMAGNALEWMNTAWGMEKNNPEFIYPYQADDRRETCVQNDILRVVRSGGWKYGIEMFRSAYRDWNPPNVRGNALGFRVAVDVQD